MQQDPNNHIDNGVPSRCPQQPVWVNSAFASRSSSIECVAFVRTLVAHMLWVQQQSFHDELNRFLALKQEGFVGIYICLLPTYSWPFLDTVFPSLADELPCVAILPVVSHNTKGFAG